MDLASGANKYCSSNLALASPEMAYALAKEKIVANAWQDVDRTSIENLKPIKKRKAVKHGSVQGPQEMPIMLAIS